MYDCKILISFAKTKDTEEEIGTAFRKIRIHILVVTCSHDIKSPVLLTVNIVNIKITVEYVFSKSDS